MFDGGYRQNATNKYVGYKAHTKQYKSASMYDPNYGTEKRRIKAQSKEDTPLNRKKLLLLIAIVLIIACCCLCILL